MNKHRRIPKFKGKKGTMTKPTSRFPLGFHLSLRFFSKTVTFCFLRILHATLLFMFTTLKSDSFCLVYSFLRKVVGKSARDNPKWYCGWFVVHCSSKKFERMA